MDWFSYESTAPTVLLRKGAVLIWLIGVEIYVLCGVAGMNGICRCQGTIVDWGYEPMHARESWRIPRTYNLCKDFSFPEI